MAVWTPFEPHPSHFGDLALDPLWYTHPGGGDMQSWDHGTYTCTAHHITEGVGYLTTTCRAGGDVPVAEVNLAAAVAALGYPTPPDWVAVFVDFVVNSEKHQIGCGLDVVSGGDYFATCGPYGGGGDQIAGCAIPCELVDASGNIVLAGPPWRLSDVSAPDNGHAFYGSGLSGYLCRPGKVSAFRGDPEELSTALLWRPSEVTGSLTLALDGLSHQGELSIGVSFISFFLPVSERVIPGEIAAGSPYAGIRHRRHVIGGSVASVAALDGIASIPGGGQPGDASPLVGGAHATGSAQSGIVRGF